jgi:hypothetical protein
VLPVAEQDELPVRGREVADGGVQSRLQLAEPQHVVRGRVGARDDRRRRLVVGGRLAERQGARLLPAEMIDRAVARDAIQPGGEPVPGVERLEGDVHLHEDLLREVHRQVARSDQPEDVVDEPALVAHDQGTEGVPVVGERQIDEALVGHSREIGRRAAHGAHRSRTASHGAQDTPPSPVIRRAREKVTRARVTIRDRS